MDLLSSGAESARPLFNAMYQSRTSHRLVDLVEIEATAPASLIENVVASMIKFCGKARPLDDVSPLELSANVHLVITPKQPVTDGDRFVERARQNHYDDDE